jgi:hypothetical protein
MTLPVIPKPPQGTVNEYYRQRLAAETHYAQQRDPLRHVNPLGKLKRPSPPPALRTGPPPSELPYRLQVDFSSPQTSIALKIRHQEYLPPLTPTLRTAPLPSEGHGRLSLEVPMRYSADLGNHPRPEAPRSATWDDRDVRATRQHRPQLIRGVENEYLSGTEHERLNEAAHELVRVQLGAIRYNELRGSRELFEMIECARVALLEDHGFLTLPNDD